MQQVSEYLSSFLQLQTGLPAAEVDACIATNEFQQFITQQEPSILLQITDKCIRPYAPPAAINDAEAFSLIYVPSQKQASTRLQLARQFKLYSKKELAQNLFTTAQQLTKLVCQEHGSDQQSKELQKTIEKFANNIRGFDAENILRSIP